MNKSYAVCTWKDQLFLLVVGVRVDVGDWCRFSSHTICRQRALTRSWRTLSRSFWSVVLLASLADSFFLRSYSQLVFFYRQSEITIVFFTDNPKLQGKNADLKRRYFSCPAAVVLKLPKLFSTERGKKKKDKQNANKQKITFHLQCCWSWAYHWKAIFQFRRPKYGPKWKTCKEWFSSPADAHSLFTNFICTCVQISSTLPLRRKGFETLMQTKPVTIAMQRAVGKISCQRSLVCTRFYWITENISHSNLCRQNIHDKSCFVCLKLCSTDVAFSTVATTLGRCRACF